MTGTVDFCPLPQSIFIQAVEGGTSFAGGKHGAHRGRRQGCIADHTLGSAVELGNDSILKINELAFQKSGGAVTERKARLELTSGVVSALVDPSTPKVTDFKIQTPEGALVARGTLYTVMVKDGKTYSTVNEGKISAIATPSRGSL